MAHTLCRDCATISEDTHADCPVCESGRVVSHAELLTGTIAHLDCDAFFAAVEKRDDPSLKDKPVIIGGGRRGVASTCCYIARLYGVRSAMPMFKALKLCPDAVVIRGNMAKYSEAGKAVREKMQALTPLVQPVSIDEAYMDLSGTERANSAAPAGALARLALDIERDIGITVSIGLAPNKFLAKTASELDKPRGFAVIGADEAMGLLAPMLPGKLHGVGPKLAERLKADGFETVEALQHMEMKDLIGRYGETGLWLHQRARGIDNRPVRIDRERKSVSSETTFSKDLSDRSTLEDHLWQLSVKTADRAKAVDVEGGVIVLKLKTKDFRTLTRRTSLSAPTQLAQTIFRTARPLLAKETNGTVFRLIGVGIAALEPAKGDAPDLLDPSVEKRAAAERAADAARAKFGDAAVKTGRGVRAEQARAARKEAETDTHTAARNEGRVD